MQKPDILRAENLLLVAGSGRNSGKTTIVCRIIEQFRSSGIISIKVSPHFHPPSEGLVFQSGKEGYQINEERSMVSSKDSSRMLKSGAEKVIYIQTEENKMKEAFLSVFMDIPSWKPVICESPALINFIEPGLFIIMVNRSAGGLKDVDKMRSFPHLEFSLEQIPDGDLPLSFCDGRWNTT